MAITKTVLKRYSGTAWDEIYLKGVSDIIELGKEINLATKVEGYGAAESISATTSVQAIIEKLAYPLVQLDKVVVPGHGTRLDTAESDITALKAGTAITEIAASKVKGVLSLENIPASAVERVVTVKDDAARKLLTPDKIQAGDVCHVTDSGKMYFVVDEAKLAEDAGWLEFTAGAAATVPWTGVTGTPTDLAGYGITDAVNVADTATTGANKVLKTNGEGKIEVDTTGNAATATNVAFTGITGLDVSVTADALKQVVAKMHEHANKTVLDALSDDAGDLAYNSKKLATQAWVEENYSSTIGLEDTDPVAGMKTGDLVLVKIV